MDDRLIGPLMIDLPGQALSAEDRELLDHPLVGGLILFTRNYRDPEQLRALCRLLREAEARRGRPLLVAVDHEGGRVQRFRVGFTRVPAMAGVGAVYREDPERGIAEARRWGRTIATELADFGIDLCFAPVLDRDTGASQVIGDRAFSSEPAEIIELARAFRAGLREAGLVATGKHFPGHGAVAADSHRELPVDRRSRAEIEATELGPFAALAGEGIESLMMAHVRYPAVDDLPASLSARWIQGLLRGDWGYDGAVFCDDLSMRGAAVAGDLETRSRLALAAGCDMLPVCNDRPAVVTLIDALRDLRPDPAASRRLARLVRSTPDLERLTDPATNAHRPCLDGRSPPRARRGRLSV